MFRGTVLLRSVAILVSLAALNASGSKDNVSTSASPCNSSPCKNGATCIMTGQDLYSCNCTEEFEGDTCESRRPCQKTDAGRCCVFPFVYKGVSYDSCTKVDWHRWWCSFDAVYRGGWANCVNLCTNNPCQNGGTCIGTGDGSYSCRCAVGYYGDSCAKVNSCTNDPCQNGGTCTVNEDGSYSCRCAVGYYGDSCAKEGQWRWSPWSDCSVTCGGGRQRRTGTCILPSTGQKLERRLCEGDHHETRNCTNGECPDWMGSVATDAKWSRWSPWTDCSSSCGKGRQSRSRTCSNKVTGKSLKNGWCAGKPQQEKTCADWKCPDGRKSTCPANREGTLKGRVLSLRDTPLAGANISLAESPYKILNRSQDNGNFKVDAFCFEKEKSILIIRHGYVPQIVGVTNSSSVLKVKMENAVHPTVKTHPEDRRRFVGQDVTFCCQVEGNPTPVIEWFRNGNILDQEEFNNNETLVLRKVGKNMTGEFRCRAVNEFGAEFSEPAALIVLDPVIDTCNSTPSDHFVTLPDGCFEDGTEKNRVNIGKCDNHPCLRADTPFLESCDEADRCCQPGTLSDTTVRCGRGEFKMKKVLSCRCDACKERTTIVKGVVVGGPDQRPVEYCDILVNDTLVSYSDFEGRFEIPVHKSAKRLVATFRDYMEEYAESTVVLPFRKGTTTFHRIHLRPEVEPIEFDPEVEKAVPIASDEAAELIIPANSLIDKDGNPKKGKAKVKVQFNDPRNERDILESPGDFTTVDEDGEEQLLRTYGIFKIKVQDENNQNLGLTKSLHLNIDLEKLTGERFDESTPIPHLWWLDEKTGRWVDAGELKQDKELTKRPKRQFKSRAFSGEIRPENIRNAINLDLSYDRCFAKVKATGQGGAAIQNAKVTSIFVNPQGQAIQGYLSRITGSNGYLCISTQCNSDGFLEVEKDGLPLLPNQLEVDRLPPQTAASIVDKRRIKFDPGAWTGNGPVYQRSQWGSCWSAGPSFFSFHRQDNRPDVFNQEYVPLVNNAAFRASSRFRRCFVKILTSGTTRTLVKAESFSPDGQTKLGETIKQTEKVDNLYAACLEYSCPQTMNTLIRFTVLTGECQRSKLQKRLDAGKDSGLAPNVEKVLIPTANVLSGSAFGIFEWSRVARQSVKEFESTCVKSAIDENAGGDLKGFAVKFNCAT